MKKQMLRNLILINLVFLGFINFGLAQAQNVNLKKDIVFGIENLPNSNTAVAGGEAFARIADIAVDNDNLYVLDGDFNKISVFDKKTGTFKKNILGGFGKGPGEFLLPLAVSITPDGNIAAYDYKNLRISFFNKDGENINELPVPMHTRSITFANDDIWLAAMSRRDSYLFSFDQDKRLTSPTELVQYLEVSEEDLEYANYGVVSFIDHINYEKILVASHRPSIWFKVAGNRIEKFGREFFPDAKAELGSDGVRNIENQSAGICHLNSKYVAVLWFHQPEEEENSYIAIDFYFEDGTFIQQKKLNINKYHSHLACDRSSNNIYLSTFDTYPRIIKYNVSIE